MYKFGFIQIQIKSFYLILFIAKKIGNDNLAYLIIFFLYLSFSIIIYNYAKTFYYGKILRKCILT